MYWLPEMIHSFTKPDEGGGATSSLVTQQVGKRGKGSLETVKAGTGCQGNSILTLQCSRQVGYTTSNKITLESMATQTTKLMSFSDKVFMTKKENKPL